MRHIINDSGQLKTKRKPLSPQKGRSGCRGKWLELRHHESAKYSEIRMLSLPGNTHTHTPTHTRTHARTHTHARARTHTRIHTKNQPKQKTSFQRHSMQKHQQNRCVRACVRACVLYSRLPLNLCWSGHYFLAVCRSVYFLAVCRSVYIMCVLLCLYCWALWDKQRCCRYFRYYYWERSN